MRTTTWPDGKPPPWRVGEDPPWSEDERPPLTALIRAYPGRAIQNAFIVLFFHGWLTGAVVCWALAHLLGTFTPNLLQLPLLLAWAIPVYLLIAAAWWVHEMDGQNRGWWQWDQEGD